MSLVGEIIMGCREQMTDLPQCLPSPVVAAASGELSSFGLFQPSEVIRYSLTQLNAFGESAGSVIATVTMPSSSGAYTLVIGGSCSFQATSIRVYFSTIANTPLEQYAQFVIQTQGTFVVFVTVVTSYSLAPLRSSAWLPDTDGTSASASTLYRWLNDGLEAIALQVGGIRDTTGIPTSVGVAQYVVINKWKKIDNIFYRGYPLIQGTKQQVFRHSPVTGLSGTVTVNTSAERQIMEFWPQPDESAGGGILSAPSASTDTTLSYTPGANGNFQLGFGMGILGTYPPTAQSGPNSCELVYFSGVGNGNQLTFLTRGLGGTQAQTWPTNTPVQEALVYMTGLRFPTLYTVGQSLLTLTLPPAWVDVIRVYLLYRFRDAEQNRNEASSLLKEYGEKVKSLAALAQIAGPRQVQVGGQGGVEIVVGAGSPFGGVILP
jgi:hypothetical protein